MVANNSSKKTFSVTLRVWRQAGPKQPGHFVDYPATNVSPDMSFLEMMDEVNLGLAKKGEDTIAFDHDCREGICGMCSQMINGIAHCCSLPLKSNQRERINVRATAIRVNMMCR